MRLDFSLFRKPKGILDFKVQVNQGRFETVHSVSAIGALIIADCRPKRPQTPMESPL